MPLSLRKRSAGQATPPNSRLKKIVALGAVALIIALATEPTPPKKTKKAAAGEETASAAAALPAGPAAPLPAPPLQRVVLQNPFLAEPDPATIADPTGSDAPQALAGSDAQNDPNAAANPSAAATPAAATPMPPMPPMFSVEAIYRSRDEMIAIIAGRQHRVGDLLPDGSCILAIDAAGISTTMPPAAGKSD